MAISKTEQASPKAETQKPETKNTVPKPKPDGTSTGFCVYIGPTILGVIQSGTVYAGDRKQVLAHLAAAVERYAPIASLVVDGSTLAVDRIKVQTPGNLLYENYRKLTKN